jgi:hypothetical protein
MCVPQVVSTALPESKNPEQVSVTVKAFMKHDLQVRAAGSRAQGASPSGLGQQASACFQAMWQLQALGRGLYSLQPMWQLQVFQLVQPLMVCLKEPEGGFHYLVLQKSIG